MASASIKSAIARIGSVDYSSLEELKKVKISKKAQKKVQKQLASAPPPPPRSESSSPLPTDLDEVMKMFNAATPLKCVRVPKREQRDVEVFMGIRKSPESP